MPNYEYKCVCGKEFTAYNKMLERATAECPDCNAIADKDFGASLPMGKGVVLNNELVADFDGKGEKVYTRRAYRDKCKELGRRPDGLLF